MVPVLFLSNTAAFRLATPSRSGVGAVEDGEGDHAAAVVLLVVEIEVPPFRVPEEVGRLFVFGEMINRPRRGDSALGSSRRGDAVPEVGDRRRRAALNVDQSTLGRFADPQQGPWVRPCQSGPGPRGEAEQRAGGISMSQMRQRGALDPVRSRIAFTARRAASLAESMQARSALVWT